VLTWLDGAIVGVAKEEDTPVPYLNVYGRAKSIGGNCASSIPQASGN